MATFGSMTSFNGDRSDIERERRMNNWIRSYSLPSEQRVAVQDAMVANPWGMQNAASQMELYNADATDLFGKTAKAYEAAMQRFAAANASRPRAQRATPTAASGGNVVTQGEINGRQVAVPTAGNYANGAYNAVLQQFGLGESPDFSAYQQAVANYISPEQRQQLRLQEEKNRGYANTADIKGRYSLEAAEVKANEATQREAMKAQLSMDKLRQDLELRGRQLDLKAAQAYGSYANSVNQNNQRVSKDISKVMSDPYMLPEQKQAAIAQLEARLVPVLEIGQWAQQNGVNIEAQSIGAMTQSMLQGAGTATPARQAPKSQQAKPVGANPTPSSPPANVLDTFLDGELRQGKDVNDVLAQVRDSYGLETAQRMALSYRDRYASRINNATRGIGNKGV